MTPSQVVKHFGGQRAAARELEVTQPSVWGWVRDRKIPYLRQLDIERRTNGKLKADNNK